MTEDGENHNRIEIEQPLDVNVETHGSVVSDVPCPVAAQPPSPQWDASLFKSGNSSVHKRDLNDASVAAVVVEWCQHTYPCTVCHMRPT